MSEGLHALCLFVTSLSSQLCSKPCRVCSEVAESISLGHASLLSTGHFVNLAVHQIFPCLQVDFIDSISPGHATLLKAGQLSQACQLSCVQSCLVCRSSH